MECMLKLKLTQSSLAGAGTELGNSVTWGNYRHGLAWFGLGWYGLFWFGYFGMTW